MTMWGPPNITSGADPYPSAQPEPQQVETFIEESFPEDDAGTVQDFQEPEPQSEPEPVPESEPEPTYIEDDPYVDQGTSDDDYYEEYVAPTLPPPDPAPIPAPAIGPPVVTPVHTVEDIPVYHGDPESPVLTETEAAAVQEIVETAAQEAVEEQQTQAQDLYTNITAGTATAGDVFAAEASGIITTSQAAEVLSQVRVDITDQKISEMNTEISALEASTDFEIAVKEAVQEAATAVDTYGEVIEVDVEALVKEASEKLGQESLSDITYDLEQGTANLVEAVDIFNATGGNLSLITTDRASGGYGFDQDDLQQAITTIAVRDTVREYEGNIITAYIKSDVVNETSLGVRYSPEVVDSVVLLSNIADVEGKLDPLAAVHGAENLAEPLKVFYDENYVEALYDVKDYIIRTDDDFEIDSTEFVIENIYDNSEYVRDVLKDLGYTNVEAIIDYAIQEKDRREAVEDITEALNVESLDTFKNIAGDIDQSTVLALAVKQDVPQSTLTDYGFNEDTVAGVQTLKSYITDSGTIDSYEAALDNKTLVELIGGGISEYDATRSVNWAGAVNTLEASLGKDISRITPVEAYGEVGIYNTGLVFGNDVSIAAASVQPHLVDGKFIPAVAIKNDFNPDHLKTLGVPSETVDNLNIVNQYYDDNNLNYNVFLMYDDPTAVQALKDLGEFTNSPQGREDKQNYEKQIDDAIVQSKAQNNIANFFDDGSDFGEDVTPGGFLKRGGDIQTLKDSGYLGDDPRKVDNLASALVTLNPFTDAAGRVDAVSALQGGVSVGTLATAGIPSEVISQARAIENWEESVKKARIKTGIIDEDGNLLHEGNFPPGGPAGVDWIQYYKDNPGTAAGELILSGMNEDTISALVALERKGRVRDEPDISGSLFVVSNADHETQAQLIKAGVTPGAIPNLAPVDELIQYGIAPSEDRQAYLDHLSDFISNDELDVVSALEGGASIDELKGAGVSNKDITYGLSITSGALAIVDKFKDIKWKKAEEPLVEVSDELNDCLREAEAYSISGSLATIDDMSGNVGSAVQRDFNERHAAAGLIRKEVENGYLSSEEGLVKLAAIMDEPLGQDADLKDAAYFIPGYGTYLTVRDARAAGWDPMMVGFVALSAAGDVATIFMPGVRGVVSAPVRVSGRLAANTARRVTPEIAKKVIASTNNAIGSRINATGARLSKLNINTLGEGIESASHRVKIDPPAPVKAVDISSYAPKDIYTPLSRSLDDPLNISLVKKQGQPVYAGTSGPSVRTSRAKPSAPGDSGGTTGDVTPDIATRDVVKEWDNRIDGLDKLVKEGKIGTDKSSTIRAELNKAIQNRNQAAKERGVDARANPYSTDVQSWDLGPRASLGDPTPSPKPLSPGIAVLDKVEEFVSIAVPEIKPYAETLDDIGTQLLKLPEHEVLNTDVLNTIVRSADIENPELIINAARRQTGSINAHINRTKGLYDDLIRLSTDSRSVSTHPQHRSWISEVKVVSEDIITNELAISRLAETIDTAAMTGAVSLNVDQIKENYLDLNQKINFQPTSTTSGISSIHAYDLTTDVASAVPVSVDNTIAKAVPATQVDVSALPEAPAIVTTKSPITIIGIQEKLIPQMLTSPDTPVRYDRDLGQWVADTDAEPVDAVSTGTQTTTEVGTTTAFDTRGGLGIKIGLGEEQITTPLFGTGISLGTGTGTSIFTGVEQATRALTDTSTATGTKAATSTATSTGTATATKAATATQTSTATKAATATKTGTTTKAATATRTGTTTKSATSAATSAATQTATKAATKTTTATAAQSKTATAQVTSVTVKQDPTKPKTKGDEGTPKMRRKYRLPKVDDEDIKRWKAANASKAVTWKQGNIWVQIYPPYDEESIFYDLQIPSGINTVRTPEKAWTKIHQLGGTIDVDTYDEWVAWFSATRESVI